MSTVSMRSATPADMPAVHAVYRAATADMQACGIAQWDALYPTVTILEDDLERGELYVVETEAGVQAAVVLNEACDPAYADADWQFAGPALIVHRLCVHPAAQGGGLGRGLMAEVERWALEHGYADLRLDAYAHNLHAQRMYARLGYVKRGEAVWRTGQFTLMEKPLLQPPTARSCGGVADV